MDELIKLGFSTVDPKKLRKVVQTAMRRAATRSGYAIPVWSPTAWVSKRKVRGLRLNYIDYVSFDRVWIAR